MMKAKIMFVVAVAAVSTLFGAEDPALPASTNSVSAMTSNADNQCAAATKSGTRCKRRRTNGSRFCKQHKLIEEKRKNAQKWLKDRKGRELSDGDVSHYRRIVRALRRTAELMAEIDKTAFLGGSHTAEEREVEKVHERHGQSRA